MRTSRGETLALHALGRAHVGPGCASGAVAPELPGGCAGRAGRERSVGPGAAGSVLMYPASLDDYKGSDVTHILTGTSEIGHIHWDESIHSLE